MLYYFLLFPHNCVSLSRDNFTGGQQRFHRIYFKLYSSHSITTEIEDKSCIAQNASVKLGQRRQHSKEDSPPSILQLPAKLFLWKLV